MNVLSPLTDPNDYAGPGTGYRMSPERRGGGGARPAGLVAGRPRGRAGARRRVPRPAPRSARRGPAYGPTRSSSASRRRSAARSGRRSTGMTVAEVLRQVLAGIEEEGLEARLVRVRALDRPRQHRLDGGAPLRLRRLGRASRRRARPSSTAPTCRRSRTSSSSRSPRASPRSSTGASAGTRPATRRGCAPEPLLLPESSEPLGPALPRPRRAARRDRAAARERRRSRSSWRRRGRADVPALRRRPRRRPHGERQAPSPSSRSRPWSRRRRRPGRPAREPRRRLRLQADFAESGGNPQLAENLRRGAELSPSRTTSSCAFYEMLRPGTLLGGRARRARGGRWPSAAQSAARRWCARREARTSGAGSSRSIAQLPGGAADDPRGDEPRAASLPRSQPTSGAAPPAARAAGDPGVGHGLTIGCWVKPDGGVSGCVFQHAYWQGVAEGAFAPASAAKHGDQGFRAGGGLPPGHARRSARSTPSGSAGSCAGMGSGAPSTKPPGATRSSSCSSTRSPTDAARRQKTASWPFAPDSARRRRRRRQLDDRDRTSPGSSRAREPEWLFVARARRPAPKVRRPARRESPTLLAARSGASASDLTSRCSPSSIPSRPASSSSAGSRSSRSSGRRSRGRPARRPRAAASAPGRSSGSRSSTARPTASVVAVVGAAGLRGRRRGARRRPRPGLAHRRGGRSRRRRRPDRKPLRPLATDRRRGGRRRRSFRSARRAAVEVAEPGASVEQLSDPLRLGRPPRLRRRRRRARPVRRRAPSQVTVRRSSSACRGAPRPDGAVPSSDRPRRGRRHRETPSTSTPRRPPPGADRGDPRSGGRPRRAPRPRLARPALRRRTTRASPAASPAAARSRSRSSRGETQRARRGARRPVPRRRARRRPRVGRRRAGRRRRRPGAGRAPFVLDLGGGTVDLHRAEGAVSTAGGGRPRDPYLRRPARLRRRAGGAGEAAVARRGSRRRSSSTTRTEAVPSCGEPAPPAALARLCISTGARSFLFTRRSPRRSGAGLRRAAKRDVLGGNLRRAIDAVGGLPRGELLPSSAGRRPTARSGRVAAASRTSTRVARGDILGRHGPRAAVAVGLVLSFAAGAGDDGRRRSRYSSRRGHRACSCGRLRGRRRPARVVVDSGRRLQPSRARPRAARRSGLASAATQTGSSSSSPPHRRPYLEATASEARTMGHAAARVAARRPLRVKGPRTSHRLRQ